MSDDSGDPVRVERYAEEVVPLCSDGTYRSHFRMHRSTFEDLCKTVGPLMVKDLLTVEKRPLATLWLFINQESYRIVADRFGLSKEHRASFINRKGLASMILQVVFDINLMARGTQLILSQNMFLFLTETMVTSTTLRRSSNKCHSSTRVDVERSIGLLKCKFRRMKDLDMQKAEEIPVVVSSCCVFHNFILDHENDSDIVADPTDDGVEEQAYNG
ncbi:hypothetical protein MAR_009147, partial [Mya arenaria]